YCCTAITAITAQNTRRVSRILEIAPAVIEDQIRSVMSDMPLDAIKVGMVYSRQTIETVSRLLKGSKLPVVLDPIFAAGTGTKLLREDAFESLLSDLVPNCSLITPNRMEAEKLAGMRIKSEADGLEAARRIKKLGAANVIIKGGHFGRMLVTDLLLDSRANVTKFANPRVKLSESHGSGCNFSSAATAYLARGSSMEDACKKANEYVHIAITNAVKIGRGLPVTNPLSTIYQESCRYQVLVELQRAVEELSELDRFCLLIPETQTNFVFALPEAKGASDVAGVRGRIVRIGNTAVPASYIEFGASKHVASSVIAFMGINSAFRSAINIKFDHALVRICKSLFEVSNYDRSREPDSIKLKEGSSVSWGTLQALSKNPRAEVVYHTGDIGKEPMITVYGRRPSDVVIKIKSILKKYQ
ncbi:MAG: bifunctional hydroxymethylpyrimidine kinase/phosphomethylpyrimidine kinase, partial [Nitrososphaera sp.]|nr:bifunctional hydroxymethylpyrimidine kinase/phosphomethylpyrimidine kinase [Nitrososphaera sp.]